MWTLLGAIALVVSGSAVAGAALVADGPPGGTRPDVGADAGVDAPPTTGRAAVARPRDDGPTPTNRASAAAIAAATTVTPTSTTPSSTTPSTTPTTPTTVAPLPPPTSPPAPPPPDADPGTGDLHARAAAALVSGVPEAWRAAIPVQLSVIGGASSWAYPDGRLLVTTRHASGDWARLRAIVAHEFGHHIAFRFGAGTHLGAPPAGWPGPSHDVEGWANCVARVFTGYALAQAGDVPCDGPALDWTAAHLAAGPP